MAYTALYREWRPKRFEDVVGQKHVTITLKNQIKNNKIPHAYLLCGTRGTGKTSTAKIISKAVNCLNPHEGEPCNECEMCKKIDSGIAIDVTELDAASNNKVENIRELIEEVQYPPQEARYKVYIIDEVHMLSIGAVNAFLKTLEEPPSYVIFILATTDPQRLPVTILSRCQRFDFKRIKSEYIFQHLRNIVDGIGIFSDDNSLKLISRICDGAMRDAVSILDQAMAMSNGKIEYNNVVEILGLVTNDNLIRLIDKIIDKNIEGAIREIDEIILTGKDVYIFIKDMITHMRNLMMVKVSDNPEEVLDMSSENIEIVKEQASKIRVEEIMRYIRILQEAEEQCKWSKQSRIYLELATVKMIKVEYDTSKEVMLARINKLESQIKNGTINLSSQLNKNNISKNVIKANEKTLEFNKNQSQKQNKDDIEINEASTITLEEVKKKWKNILELFKTRRKMVIYVSLTTGRPVRCDKGVIEIKYDPEFAFNKSRLEKEPIRAEVEELFTEALNEPIRITYTVDKKQDETDTEDIIRDTFQGIDIEVLE